MSGQRQAPERGSFYLHANHGSYCPTLLVNVAVKTMRCRLPGTTKKWAERFAYGAACRWRFLGGKNARMEWAFFEHPGQFWQWFVMQHKERRGLWLVSHELGRVLTLLDFWELVDNGFYSLYNRPRGEEETKDEGNAKWNKGEYLLITRDPPTVIRASHGEHYFTGVDLRNYFQGSMPELEEIADLAELPEPKGLATVEHWEEYLRRQVQIQRQALVKLFQWWSSNDMGVFRYTAGALALSYFRHRHLRQPILIDDCQPARELSRQALTGGECRLFYCGKVVDEYTYNDRRARAPKKSPLRLRAGPVYVYDANSLYPAVMRKNRFPRELVAYKDNCVWEDLESWRKRLCLVARVLLDSPKRPWPLEVEKERYWATGRFWTTLAGPELDAALVWGVVREVKEIAAYLPGELFTSYVDELYPQKVKAGKAGQNALAAFYKMLLNSLPGKLSQRTAQWEWDDYPSPGQRWGRFSRVIDGKPDSKAYRVIAGYTQVEGDKLDALHSLPAIEAYVNAYARVFMFDVRRQIGEEHILYMDTDSLHLTETGHQRVQALGIAHPWELGKFKLEGTYQTADYRGPKDYTVDGVHVVAGRKRNAEPDGPSQWMQDESEQLDSIVGREPGGIVYHELVTKKHGRYHPNGILLPDGRVLPPSVRDGHLSFRRRTEPQSGIPHRRTRRKDDPPF